MSGAVYTLDAYEVLEKLGEGVYGEVFKCIHKETGNIVAVKHIKRGNDSASAMLQELTALEALEGLDPDFNLINLNDWFQSKNGDFFMEFEMLDQSVFDLMTKRNSSFSLSEIRPMARDMLVALKGLRTVGVIHTDIKPDNIMLVDHKNKPFKVKLIDFGVAVLKEQVEIGEMLQPAAYRSPEVTLGLPITGAIDMWSLACCLLEWYLQIFPFNVEDSYDSLRQITHLLGVPDGDLIMRAEDGTSYFVREKYGKWRLKTPSEYRDLDGKMPKLDQNFLEAATGLDDAVLNSFEIQSGMEYEDRRAFLDLLRKMLEFDPEKRITPTEALEHPFITLSHFRDRSYVADSEKLLAFTPCYDPIAEEQKPKRQKRFHIDWLSPSIVSSSDAFNSMSHIWSYEDSDSSANSSLQSSHSSSMSDSVASKCIFKVHYVNYRDTQEKEKIAVRCKGTYDAQKGKDDGSKLPICQPSPKVKMLQNCTYNAQSNCKVHFCRYTQEKERSVVLRTGTFEAQKGKDDGSKSPVCQPSPKARKLQNSTYNGQCDFNVHNANCWDIQEKERSVVLRTSTFEAQKGKDDGSKSPVCQPSPKARKLQNCTYNAQSDYRPVLKSFDKRLESPFCPSKKGKTQNRSPISSDSDGPADVCSFTPERIVHVSNWRDICFSNDSTIDSQEVDSEAETEEEEADLEQTGYMAITLRDSYNAQSKNRSVEEDFKTQRSSGTYMDESEEDCPTMFQSTHNRCLEPVGNFKVHEAEYGNQATVESQDLKINSPVPPLGVQLPSSNEISNGKSPNEGLRTSTYNISKDEGFENEMARTTLCQGSKVTSPTISPLEYTDIQETEQTLNVCKSSWVGPTSTERPEEVLAIPETVLGEKFLKTETIADFIPDVMSTSEEVTYTGNDSASLSLEHPIISHNEHEQILKTHTSLPFPKTKVIQTSSGEKSKAAETLHDTVISNQPENVEVREHQPLPSQRDDDDDEGGSSICNPLCSSLIKPVLDFISSSLFSFSGFLTSENI